MPINAIYGIIEPVFTPDPPLVVLVSTKGQFYALNRLVEELRATFFAFPACILHRMGLRLH